MDVFLHSLSGALMLATQLILIIVPLLTIFELLRYMAFFRRVGDRLDPVMSSIGLTKASVLPLCAGVFLGISYGAGIIIRVAKNKGLSSKELIPLGLFLVICHGVVEDTLIFTVAGGNGFVILGARILLAVCLTGLWFHGARCRNSIKLPGDS